MGGKLRSPIYGIFSSEKTLQLNHKGKENGYYIGWDGTFTNTYTYTINGGHPYGSSNYPINSNTLYLGTGGTATTDSIKTFKSMSVSGVGIPDNTIINGIDDIDKSISISNSITNENGIPITTTITITIVSYGTITGYNMSTNLIQVCLSNTNHITDDTTVYKIIPMLSLNENSVLYEDYYNNWDITISNLSTLDEGTPPNTYTITSYKDENISDDILQNFIGPEGDVTALLTTDNTLSISGGFSLNYIHLKYFQDWYISIYSGENYNALTAPISESNLSYGKITNNTEKIIGNQIIFTIEWHVTSSNLTTLRNANTNFKYFISFNPKSFGNTSSGSWTQNDSNVVDQELNYRQIKGVIK